MKKFLAAAGAAALTMAFASTASAQVLTVTPNALPVPVTAFDGEFDRAEGENGFQEGYLSIYEDGVEACNGNPDIARPDTGEPLQGYIWIGSAHAPENQLFADPTGNVGAGSGDSDDDGVYEEGEAPCPRGSSVPD